MANIENNKNTGNSNDTENFGEKMHDAVENVKHTIQHPIESLKQAKEEAKKLSWWAKLFLFFVAFFGVLVLALFIFINLPATKDAIAERALEYLNKDFGIQISKKNIEINYFGDVIISGLDIKDYKNNDLIVAKKLKAETDLISIIRNSRDLKFSTITLSDADVKVVTYKGDSISNFIRFIDKFDDGTPRDPKKKPFQLNSRIQIENSRISIINANHDGDEGKWLQATEVNALVHDLQVVGPNVSAKINNFSFFTKRWGKEHQMKTFSADFAITNERLSLKDLTMETSHSLLQGDLVFNLDPKTHWSDFTNKVIWEMDLKRGSNISGYDISYFVTNWDNYQNIALSGKMNGTLNDFRLQNFLVKGKQVDIYAPAMKFTNLLNGNFNIVTEKISANLTYPALRAMVPSFVAKKMKNFADPFGTINYNGSVNVTPTRVIAKGTAITSIGQAKANITLSDIDKEMPHYVGILDVKNFNSAAITKNNSVGLISGKFNVDGRGFDVNTMELRTKSEVAQIEINGKPIRNLFLDGTMVRKQYNGTIKANDPQVKGEIVGKIDFSTSRLLADVKGNIDYINLNYFGVQGQKTTFRGGFDGKIAFTNLNDMNLDSKLQNVVLELGNTKYDVPNGTLKAFFENGERIVDVDMPNVIKGKIQGRFNLGDLSGMIQNGLDKILVGNKIKKSYYGQQFSFNFEVNQALVNYFQPNVKIANGAKVDGSYDGNANNLVLNADIPSVKYLMTKKEEIAEVDQLLAKANPDYKIPESKTIRDSAMIDQMQVKINTANLEEQIFAKINRVAYKDNIFRDVLLSGKNQDNQLLHITANFKHGTPEDEENQALKSYAINFNQSTNEQGDLVFKFEPTEFKLNNFVWNVDTSSEMGHSITYRKKTGDFSLENLSLYSDNSKVLIKNAVFKSAEDFEADAEVENVDISKLFDLQNDGNNLDIKGIANGKVHIKMNKKSLEPIVDLEVSKVLINGKDMGTIKLGAKISDKPNVFVIDSKISSAGLLGNNNLELTGTIDNNTKSPTLNLAADLKDFDLGFGQEFVKSVFGNIRGKATGVLKIGGTMDNVDYNGDIALKGVGLKLNFTGVDYRMDDTVISLSKGLAMLPFIGIKDERGNSSGNISGSIMFETLSSMGVNLVLHADDLMLLNTKQKDFDLFWGTVYGKGDLYVSGPITELSLETPEMKAINNSSFTFNSNSATNVDEYKMVRFLKTDKTGAISAEERKKSTANMNIDFTAFVDKTTNVSVLVGDEIGDISVRGNTDETGLRFRMSRQGNILMNGSYIVDNGTYISKAILNRTFQIAKSSNLRWDGDAMSPTMDIVANYPRSVTNLGEYLGIGKIQPINVLLQSKISGSLTKPIPKLDIIPLDVSSQLTETLNSKLSDDNERTIQFGSILLLNSFNVNNDLNFGIYAENTLYNTLFKQLGSVLNSISREFQFDIGYVKDNFGDRANAGVSILLSPRFTVKTGLGFPVTKSSSLEQNYLSGEGTVEWDFSKKNDGTRILRAYSKPSNIGMVSGSSAGSGTGNNQSYGIGVVYSKSFNSFFKKKDKLKKSETTNPKIKTDSLKKDSIK